MANLPRMELVHGDRTVQWITYGRLEGGQMSNDAYLELLTNLSSVKHLLKKSFILKQIKLKQLINSNQMKVDIPGISLTCTELDSCAKN